MVHARLNQKKDKPHKYEGVSQTVQARYNKTTIRVHRLPLLPGEETCRNVWMQGGRGGLELPYTQAVRLELPEREGLWSGVFNSDSCSATALILRSFQRGQDGLTWHNLPAYLPEEPAIPQLSFQCWGQKMPSPAEFSGHRL